VNIRCSSTFATDITMLESARKQTVSPVDSQNRKNSQLPRAWQGHNPITQRSSYSAASSNGVERTTKGMLPSQMKSTSDAHGDKHAHDRALFLFAQFVGKDATITLRNGEQFSGIFTGGIFESTKTLYTLKMAKRTRLPLHDQTSTSDDSTAEFVGQGYDHVLSIDIQDTVDLFVSDVTVVGGAPSQNGSSKPLFLTDTQISSKEAQAPTERVLQRWTPGPDTSVDLSLDDSGETGWDQFATNKEKFGVSTDYDENIYTTAIDRSNPQYHLERAKAERIAREIESSAPANAHVAEERQRDAMQTDGTDEEDKYSGVRRDVTPLPKRATGAYVPPSQRPITSAQTVPGAPFDPAIISSQIKTLPKSSGHPADHDLPLPAAPHQSNSFSNQPTVTISADQPVVGNTDRSASIAVPTFASTDHAIGGSQASTTAQVPKRTSQNTTEDHVRGTADAFKQFANNEKLRIRAAQEAKRVNQRQEKNVKLNDLKKFAANFKLKSRVPDDLVPILAKDRVKQIEIQSRAEEAAKEEELRQKEKDTEKPVGITSPPGSASAVAPQQNTASPVDQRAALPAYQRSRQSQQMRGINVVPGQSPSPRAHSGQQRTAQHNPQFYARPNFSQSNQPDPRVPSTQLVPPAADLPVNPAAATGPRLNVNAKAFEFRPAASAFTPSGASPSPQRPSAAVEQPRPQTPAAFFGQDKGKGAAAVSTSVDPIKRIAEAEYTDAQKKHFNSNGGIPHAYNTPPTWSTTKANESLQYLTLFPKPPQVVAPGMSLAMPTPPMMSVPHGLQGPALVANAQRQPYFVPGQHGPGPVFDPRMPPFGPNGSVHNSPRVHAAAPFNGQVQQMPNPFTGQQLPGYGMSPSMQYRQIHTPGGPMMPMMPGQPQGQMGAMRPMYPQGPQYPGGPQMGGHMMQQQPSGGYAGGPVPQQGYSPMPPHAQPHMQQHLPPHGGPGNYAASPRPHLMQHQGSHQGYNPPMPMQPSFSSSPGHPHPYHMQQRAMSSQFAQMTPRQQHAVPQHSSPSVGGVTGPGDEGK